VDSDKNVVLTVPEGAQVLVRRYDSGGRLVGDPVALVTEDDLAALRKDLMAEVEKVKQSVATTNDNVVTLEASVHDVVVGNITKVTETIQTLEDGQVNVKAGVKEANDAIAKVKTTQGEILDDLVKASDARENATDCLSNVVAQVDRTGDGIASCPAAGEAQRRCPDLSPPLHGKIAGAGTLKGALRRFTCETGFDLVGSAETVCGSNHKWSHPAPECVGMVTCTFAADNWVHGFFADGKQLATKDTGAGVKVVKFPVTAKSIGIAAGDGEIGCRSGQMAVSCTSVGKSPYHELRSDTNLKQWRAIGVHDWDVFKGSMKTYAQTAYDDSAWSPPIIGAQGYYPAPNNNNHDAYQCVANDFALYQSADNGMRWVYPHNECGFQNRRPKQGFFLGTCADEQKPGNYPGYTFKDTWKANREQKGVHWFFRFVV